MKKLAISLIAMIAFVFSVHAQETQNGPKIEFEKVVHDFGKIKQYGNATTTFTFTNTGTEPLIISNARGSCGCTVPTWPREPIAPGESGTIKVKYDSKRTGPINKSVTITSNAVNAPTKVLRIKGYIDPAPQPQTTPVNQNAGSPVAK